MLVDRPEQNKLVGLYRGIVLQHLTHGRLKVWVPSVNAPELSAKPEQLPPAEQLTPSFAGSNTGNGVFSYPNIGAAVICQFINGDQNLPIVIGCTLGGDNAFGQYEIIRGQTEMVSPRHLITSGKSQIEIYESGKISALVADPIRTDASAQHVTDVRQFLSGEHVSDRPVMKKVATNEISNVYCQHVLDNTVGRGEISSETYRYDIKNELCNVFLSDENILSNTIDKLNGTTRTIRRHNNSGYVGDVQISSTELQQLTSTTDIGRQINESFSLKKKTENETDEHQYIDGYLYTGAQVKSELTDTYNYVDNGSKVAILELKTIKDKSDASTQLDISGNIFIDANVERKVLSTYNNSQTQESIVCNDKVTRQNSVDVWENCGYIGTTYKDDLNYVNLTQQYTHMDKRTQQYSLDLDTGYDLKSKLDDVDTKIIGGNSTITTTKNTNYMVADTDFSKSAVKVFSKYYKKVQMSGTESLTHVECIDKMDSKEGVIEVKITDVQSGKYCQMKMDSKGNIDVDSSTSINFKSPSISFTGDTLTTRFGNVTRNEQNVIVNGSSYSATFTDIKESGSSVNINGGGGDVVVSGISLVKHTHTEMQAGDVVAPGPKTTPPS